MALGAFSSGEQRPDHTALADPAMGAGLQQMLQQLLQNPATQQGAGI